MCFCPPAVSRCCAWVLGAVSGPHLTRTFSRNMRTIHKLYALHWSSWRCLYHIFDVFFVSWRSPISANLFLTLFSPPHANYSSTGFPAVRPMHSNLLTFLLFFICLNLNIYYFLTFIIQFIPAPSPSARTQILFTLEGFIPSTYYKKIGNLWTQSGCFSCHVEACAWIYC